MKLTTVLSAVNSNKSYYMFIPKQILFWKKFNIKFIAVFVGEALPDELKEHSDNIIVWSKNVDLNTAYVAQIMRIYYPALLKLPDDELVMITDMDMLPTNDTYYTKDLDHYKTEDFIYYRHIDGDQIYMCYNAAHPTTWGNIFNIHSDDDIERHIYDNYNKKYNGIPGEEGWYTDQLILYKCASTYPHLKVLNRPLKRLEMSMYKLHLRRGDTNFICKYDDAHFHRNYENNLPFILDAEKQLCNL